MKTKFKVSPLFILGHRNYKPSEYFLYANTASGMMIQVYFLLHDLWYELLCSGLPSYAPLSLVPNFTFNQKLLNGGSWGKGTKGNSSGGAEAVILVLIKGPWKCQTEAVMALLAITAFIPPVFSIRFNLN